MEEVSWWCRLRHLEEAPAPRSSRNSEKVTMKHESLMMPFVLCLSKNLWRVQMLLWFVGDNFYMVVGHFFEHHMVSQELESQLGLSFMQSPWLLTDKYLCEGVIDGWKQLAALFLWNMCLFFNYSKARKALTERQKDLEMKTQQLEVKLRDRKSVV